MAFAGDARLGDGSVKSKSNRRRRKRRLDGTASRPIHRLRQRLYELGSRSCVEAVYVSSLLQVLPQEADSEAVG